MATMTLDREALGELRPGDRVIAIDTFPLGDPIIVAAPLGATGVVGVKTVYDTPSGVERYLYSASVGESITVDRDEVADPPAKPRKPRRRPEKVRINRYAVPLVRLADDSFYRTEDGRYEIRLNHGYITGCDEPHPVRMGASRRAEILNNLGRTDIPSEAKFAARDGRDGYRCPGGFEHDYAMWVIWDNQIDDYIGRSAETFDTLAGAAGALAYALGLK